MVRTGEASGSVGPDFQRRRGGGGAELASADGSRQTTTATGGGVKPLRARCRTPSPTLLVAWRRQFLGRPQGLVLYEFGQAHEDCADAADNQPGERWVVTRERTPGSHNTQLCTREKAGVPTRIRLYRRLRSHLHWADVHT
jgi:hypothetical protein